MKLPMGTKFSPANPKHSQSAPWPESMTTVASAALVNRTHRVVRERARNLQARKRTLRSLWIPLAVSGMLLAVLVIALWTAFEEYEASPVGLPDTSQMLVLLMWSVPVTAMLLAVVWFRRSRTENEGAR